MPDDGRSTPGAHAPGQEALRHAREVLEAVATDRSLLAQLPDEERRALLLAAGRTVHPEVEQKRRLVKALRQAKRRRIEAHDRGQVAAHRHPRGARGERLRAAAEAAARRPPRRASPCASC